MRSLSNKKIDIADKQKVFIYFGLINKSKAFNEMLEAWNRFNQKRKSILKIITSSDIYFSDIPKNVEVYKNLSDDEVINVFDESQYVILPIVPEVSPLNATFKTASLFGCISIGRFIDEFTEKTFIININSYDKDTFSDGLIKAFDLDKSERIKMSKEAIEFGQKYSPQKTAEKIVTSINKLLVNGET